MKALSAKKGTREQVTTAPSASDLEREIHKLETAAIEWGTFGGLRDLDDRFMDYVKASLSLLAERGIPVETGVDVLLAEEKKCKSCLSDLESSMETASTGDGARWTAPASSRWGSLRAAALLVPLVILGLTAATVQPSVRGWAVLLVALPLFVALLWILGRKVRSEIRALLADSRRTRAVREIGNLQEGIADIPRRVAEANARIQERADWVRIQTARLEAIHAYHRNRARAMGPHTPGLPGEPPKEATT